MVKVGEGVTIVAAGAPSRGLSSAVSSRAMISSVPVPTRISSGFAPHVAAMAERSAVARGSG